MSNQLKVFLVFSSILLSLAVNGQDRQLVEGFDTVAFHHNDTRTLSKDFRGMRKGYLTAGWWVPGHVGKNMVSWRTAKVPEKKPATFEFIAATSVLPSEISKGPQVKLSVNGKYALTFTLGMMRNYIWKEGEYELKYVSKRVEFPYTGSHREFELNGNSGIFELGVPASVVEAGKAAMIEAEILPFERWKNGWFMVKDYKDVMSNSIEVLKGEIDALQRDMATVMQQTHMLATQVYSEMLGAGKFEHHVIYTNGFRHEHPADLIKLKNGELLITTREGNEHISNDGDVIMLRSKDNGKTWGEKQVIAAIKDVDEREGCGIQLKDGTIVVGIFYNNLYDKEGVYNTTPLYASADKRVAEPGKRYLGAYTIRSKDNGHTWSSPSYIETTGMPFTNLEGPTDAPIEMPDGSLLMGVIGYNPGKDVGNRSAVMLRSTDKGNSWSYLATMASDPGGKLGGFLEPGIVRTNTGRIVTIMRNHGGDNSMYGSYSDDDGKTWVTPFKTNMIGHPGDLIQLADGRLMATYGIRESQHTKPGGIRACFSSDNGKTWDIKTEVQIRNDFINWDVGYPESLELGDGRVLTVYYFNLFGKYYIGGSFWKP
ncbi:MAG: sialidase family protein [Chitinophagaceae bacterium]